MSAFATSLFVSNLEHGLSQVAVIIDAASDLNREGPPMQATYDSSLVNAHIDRVNALLAGAAALVANLIRTAESYQEGESREQAA